MSFLVRAVYLNYVTNSRKNRCSNDHKRYELYSESGARLNMILHNYENKMLRRNV